MVRTAAASSQSPSHPARPLACRNSAHREQHAAQAQCAGIFDDSQSRCAQAARAVKQLLKVIGRGRDAGRDLRVLARRPRGVRHVIGRVQVLLVEGVYLHTRSCHRHRAGKLQVAREVRPVRARLGAVV
eukprot:4597264-Prymnesium_polylepis.3